MWPTTLYKPNSQGAAQKEGVVRLKDVLVRKEKDERRGILQGYFQCNVYGAGYGLSREELLLHLSLFAANWGICRVDALFTAAR